MRVAAPQSPPQDTMRLENTHQLSESSGLIPNYRKSSHPFLALIYMILKVIVVALFILLRLFFNPLSVAQIVIILAAIDFWITKNLAGRLLVGLRWWVDFDELGEEHWKFECKVNELQNNPVNTKIFWWSLALFSAIWILLSIFNILRLNIQDITVSIYCAALLLFNLYWFYKCSKVQQKNVKRMAAQYGQQALQRFMGGSIIANFL